MDSNYSNHLRSQGHIDNIIKKPCCTCISKLSLKSDVGIQTDFPENLDSVIDVDPNILVGKFKKVFGINHSKQKMILMRLR